jgi:membrane fusion protein (multidrug efflux system)
VLGLAGLVALASAWAIFTSDGAVARRERDSRLAAARTDGGANATPVLEVETMRIARESAPEIVEIAGVLEPVRSTWVAAEIAGRVVEVPVEEYARVEAGDLLVQLDPALPEAERIRAAALHALARDELERQRSLGSRSVASEAELDRALAEERRAYADLLEARTRLAHTRIVAPFDGLVNELVLDPGAYVQPGTPIAQILDVSTIELTVLVGDRQIGALSAGGTARVRIDPLGNEFVDGRIVRVGRAAQDASGRYPVVVGLANDEGRLLPGMLAHVQLEIGTAPAIRIPSSAIVREFELDYVYVLDEDDAVRRQRIATRPVPFRPDQVEVREGLEPGDRIVVSDVRRLASGQRVLVR